MSVSYGGDSITFADNSTISSGWTGFKNRIINGGMVINQRALGTVSASGSCILDRFINYRSGGAYSVQQSTDAPAGFTNSMLMTNTTAASPTTFSFFGQIIEGNNIADFNFGTANASAITVSFWVKSSVAGVYSISITNGNGDRAYAATYTINNTNTWEKETITIPGDVTGTWATNNTSGMFLRINLGSPAGRTTTSGSWVGGNFDGATGSTGATTWANTLNATFYVTGVQLERGSTASSFEYRPYGTELALCQRYYVTLVTGADKTIAMGAYQTSTYFEGVVHFPVSMRVTPSLECTTGTDYYAIYRNGWDYLNSLSAEYLSPLSSTVYNNTEAASGTAGAAYWLTTKNANSRLSFSAEL